MFMLESAFLTPFDILDLYNSYGVIYPSTFGRSILGSSTLETVYVTTLLPLPFFAGAGASSATVGSTFYSLVYFLASLLALGGRLG